MPSCDFECLCERIKSEMPACLSRSLPNIYKTCSETRITHTQRLSHSHSISPPTALSVPFWIITMQRYRILPETYLIPSRP